MFITLKRIIKTGLKTFWRNGLLSSASILTVTITLVASTFVYFGILLSESTLARLDKKVDINIYFTPQAGKTKVLEFRNEVLNFPSVDKEKSEFLTKEEALEDFQKDEEDKKMLEDVLDILKENPMGAVLNIKAKSLEDYKKIIKYLESDTIQAKYLDIIDSTNYNENEIIINKINIWTKYLKIIGTVALGILLFISMILIYNTIRLIIYSYKEEIQVMKLIGASNFYARGPFLIEGILYGLVSGILSIGLILIILYFTVDFFKELFVLNLYQYFVSNILEISVIIILSGVIISFISTYFAVAKYLNVER